MTSDFDPRDFRSALGKFPTGVCVITTCGPDGKKEGLTANSFASVSLEPPIVSWSIRNGAPSLETFLASGYFCINLLTIDQEALSSHFCRPKVDKFEEVLHVFEMGLGRSPRLIDALATFECECLSHHAVGDHIVFYGTVRRYRHRDVDPLVFHGGAYCRVAAPH